MSYTSENETFNLKQYIDYIVNQLSEDQKTEDIRKTIETNVVNVVIQTVRNFMSYEDLMDLMDKMDQNNDKSNEILSEYISSNSELEELLSKELNHFEEMASNYF